MGSIIKFFVFLLGLVGLSASKKRKEEESLVDKKKKTMGFVAEGVKPKRKYTRRKKKNAVKK